jgi:hypothetical protein
MIAGTLTTRAAWVLTAAVVAISGCSLGCDRPVTSAPSAATAATPTAPAPTPTFTLSGVVARRSPSGQIPVDYVQVRIANALREATTDAHGHYSISGLPAVDTSVLFTKWGYDSLASIVKMSGDTTLDVSLNRQPTFVLWGVVSELTAAGQVIPVPDVEVYCDACGEEGHTFAHTDADGLYGFPVVYVNPLDLLLRKDGYTNPPGTPPSTIKDWLARRVNVAGDTRFDIQIARR